VIGKLLHFAGRFVIILALLTLMGVLLAGAMPSKGVYNPVIQGQTLESGMWASGKMRAVKEVVGSRVRKRGFPASPAISTLTLAPFGVQMLGEERDERVLALAQQAGVRWVRIYLSWATIEPSNTTPGNYNWTGYDSLFANLASYGFIPIVTISSNPSWAAR